MARLPDHPSAAPNERTYEGPGDQHVTLQRACPDCVHGLLVMPARYCPKCSGAGFLTRTLPAAPTEEPNRA